MFAGDKKVNFSFRCFVCSLINIQYRIFLLRVVPLDASTDECTAIIKCDLAVFEVGFMAMYSPMQKYKVFYSSVFQLSDTPLLLSQLISNSSLSSVLTMCDINIVCIQPIMWMQ